MLARHPKTGATIRIMNLDTSAWRDQKTLVWLDGVPAGASSPAAWNRWEVGATSIAAAGALAAAGIRPDIILCLDPVEEAHDWIRAGHWSEASIVVMPRALAAHIGLEKLQEYNVRNMLCLEELCEVYPHTGTVWDGTLEDAKLLVAMTLRLGRTFPVAADGGTASRLRLAADFGLELRSDLAADYGLELRSDLPTPPPLWLVTQYYVPDKAKRRREIAACLEANLACPLVDHVVLLNEEPCAPKHAKLTEKVIGKRISYADVLRWIRDEAPADAIVVFANADIFLDAESFRLLWSVNLDTPARFFALLRWEVEGTHAAALEAARIFGPRGDSQDTWVVSAAAVKRAFADQADWTPFEIPFGQAGCDNAITGEMLRKKFQIVNPAVNLRTFHYHTSQVRNYDPGEIVERAMYVHIQPTGLQDMRPIQNIPEKPTMFKGRSFDRLIKGPLTPARAKIFCTMLARSSKGEIQLDPNGANTWEPAPVPLYKFSNVFQSREGLVYDYSNIFVGRSKACAEAWTKAQLSSVAAAVRAETSIAAPLSDAVAADPGKYVLYYIGKVLLAKKMLGLPGAEFWGAGRRGAGVPAATDALRVFNWPKSEVPVLSRDDTMQAWSEELGAWLPQDGAAELVTGEEVDALREGLGLGGWMAVGAAADAAAKRLVICVDSSWMSQEVAEDIETALQDTNLQVKFIWAGRTNLEATVSALRGAWGLILFSKEVAPWAWVMPRGAFVWEVQSEMEPSAALLHLAAAADLEHRLLIVGKGAPTVDAKKEVAATLARSVLEELNTEVATEKAAAAAAAEADKARNFPRLIMPAPPAANGMFRHAGDSFREMARLWAARDYVDLQEDPTATQVWLHGKGKVLLYDRPTLEWLAAAPPGEKTWDLALFGNAAAPAGAPASKRWFFWPRRPELVEELVAAGAADAGYQARGQSLVFYGRSENAVQRGRRTKADWSAACSEFVHVDGEKPYPFTQRQYLERLAGARFGLCLAGYGLKCHREVECMAMGCVPIVAPEVDMDGYANPPREGIHYFRAATPEEAKRLATTTAPDRWAMMSAAAKFWWRANASAEGSWELTKKLVA